MGRESSDPIGLHSSIALLQERFRQLQRVKEMREERELLRVFADCGPATSAPCEPQQPEWFLHRDSLRRPSRPLHRPPNLRLGGHGGREESQAFEASVSMGLYPDRRRTMQNSRKSEMDIDTSLHL